MRSLVRTRSRNCSPSRAHPRGQLIPTCSGRMSLAARGCCCPLDAGSCSARTQKFSGMARDDGHEKRHSVSLLLHGLVASLVLASASSFWSTTLYTETMAASGRLGQALVMRQSTVAFESIFSFVLALFALGLWCIISVSLYLAVIVPGVWVLLMSTKIGFFGRRLFSWGQCLVLQWIHALRQFFGYGRISHMFLRCGGLGS